MQILPSISRLNELLCYDPETGEFTWRKGRKKAAKGATAGYVRTDGYLFICIDYKKIGAHRIAWAIMTGQWCDDVIDHANTNKLDNRWSNLRKANKSLNAHNTGISRSNTSGAKCVFWNKQRSKWQAITKINGTRYHVGLFDTKEQASEAYFAFSKEKIGEFAHV